MANKPFIDENNNGIPDSTETERVQQQADAQIIADAEAQQAAQQAAQQIEAQQQADTQVAADAQAAQQAQVVQETQVAPQRISIDDSLARGFRLQKLALGSGALLGVKEARKQEVINEDAERRILSQDVANREREIERQDILESELNKLQVARQEMLKIPTANIGIFQGKSTGQQLTAAISIALAGLGNALAGRSGATNPALEILDNQVDREMDRQRFKLGQAKSSIQAQENVLGKMRLLFRDERQAEAATRLTVIDQMKLKIQTLAGKYKPKKVKLNASTAMGHLEVAEAKERLKFSESGSKIAAKRVEQTTKSNLRKMAIEAQDPTKDSLTPTQVAELDLEFPQQKFRNRAVTLPDGSIRIARDTTTKQNFDKSQFGAQTVLGAIDRLEGLMARFGEDEVLNRSAVQAESSIRQAINLDLKEVANLGVLNGKDLVIIEGLTGGAFFGFAGMGRTADSKRAAIKEMRAYINQKILVRAQQAGLLLKDEGRALRIASLMRKKKLGKEEAEAQVDKLIALGKIRSTSLKLQ